MRLRACSALWVACQWNDERIVSVLEDEPCPFDDDDCIPCRVLLSEGSE